jgi:Flp pilus assembly protein CpaB
MRSRGLVVALALLLAAGAAAAVVLYTNGVKQQATTGGNLTTVIVATQDIPAGTALDALVEQGGFKELEIPVDAVVQGAVTNVQQLRGQTTTAPIVTNQQIVTSSLSGGEQVQGGALGISPGHIAVTVRVNVPEGVNGDVQRGDNVTVYATFQDTKVIPGSLQQLLTGTAPTTAATSQELPDFTVTLIPTVKVLDVQNPVVDQTNGTTTGSTSANDTVTLTLDLTKKDAQNLVFAAEGAQLWFGLLPPGEQGGRVPASLVPIELLLGKKP